MKKAGVSSPPGFTYAEFIRSSDQPVQFWMVWQSLIMLKDFDVWLKAFDAEALLQECQWVGRSGDSPQSGDRIQ
jgi:hypothetical protein